MLLVSKKRLQGEGSLACLLHHESVYTGGLCKCAEIIGSLVCVICNLFHFGTFSHQKLFSFDMLPLCLVINIKVLANHACNNFLSSFKLTFQFILWLATLQECKVGGYLFEGNLVEKNKLKLCLPIIAMFETLGQNDFPILQFLVLISTFALEIFCLTLTLLRSCSRWLLDGDPEHWALRQKLLWI